MAATRADSPPQWFKGVDKKALLQEAGGRVWRAICDGSAVQDPALAFPALLLTHADLKGHRYLHWCCFPALVPPQPVRGAPVPVDALLAGGTAEEALAAVAGLATERGMPPLALLLPAVGAQQLRAQPLAHWASLSDAERAGAVFALVDPCPRPEHPGWLARNAVALLRRGLGLRGPLRLLCLRRGAGRSLGLRVEACADPGLWEGEECPRCVGWEPDARGRMRPRVASLREHLDPARLAASSADLNLRLMRWRMLPELDVGALRDTRCLLLGAGTLGCAVARTLVGWGFRALTLVDNGRVSYSNPVRQSLFTHEDCLHGGRWKAEAAADALRRILPSVEAAGRVITIPQPGHPVGSDPAERARLREDVDALRGLVQAHDVVFLLTDSRESRWLPTLLAAAEGKLALNVALGFDSYLVMRHGVYPASPAGEAGEAGAGGEDAAPRLGCYFCNDVVAPANSTRDRTLDQQCTVTRPGLAPIAGATAVELLVALLHHPARQHAPADEPPRGAGATALDPRRRSTPLGVVPHQLRTFLQFHHTMQPRTPAFPQCTACSPSVLDAWRTDGADFVERVLDDPAQLERHTGLAAMREAVDALDLDLDWDEDVEGEEEGEQGVGAAQ